MTGMKQPDNHTDRTPENDAPARIRRIALLSALAVLASAVLAMLIEALTIFGEHTHSLLDPTSWSKRRLIAFFLLSLAALAYFRSRRRMATEARRIVHVRPRRDRVIASSLATLVAIALGMLAGGLVAVAAGTPSDPRYGIAIATPLVIAALLVANAGLIRRAAEWGFLAIAIPVTTCMCLIMPTAAEISWDGQIHFDSANALSYLSNPEYTGADQLMTLNGPLEGCFTATGARKSDIFVDFGFEAMERSNAALRSAEQEQPVRETKGTACNKATTWVNWTAPGWIPNALGLWVGRALHLDCIARYTLGRLCNSLFYCTVFFFAIRRLRRGKLIASAIGLFPTSLFMAANYSYDPWLTCLVTYAFCRFVGRLQSTESMDARDGAAIALTFFAGALVKAVIFPLALAFFLVPRNRFSSSRERIAYNGWIIASMAGLLMSFALPFVVNLNDGTKMGDMRGGTGVDSGSQVGFIVAHPVKATGIIVSHAFQMVRPDNLSSHLFYMDAYLHPIEFWGSACVGWVEYVLLLFVSLFDHDERETYLGPIYKVAGILLPFATLLLITLALYISFTAVGSEVVAGVQYRYLIPLAPCFCLLTLNFKRLRSLIPEQVTSSVFHVVVAIATVAPIFLSFVTQF